MDIQFKLGYVKESGSLVEWPYYDKLVMSELNITGSINDDTIISHSYFPLYQLLPSSHSEEEIPEALTDVEKSGSVYYLNYTIRNKTEEELALHYEHGWLDVRRKRDGLLLETDYMANSDYPITDEWRTYRQALRDITTQSSPFTITWPTKPE